SVNGNVQWTFRVPVPAGAADDYLPPSASNAWELNVHEGGFLNRSGRITAARLIWHTPGGDFITEGGPTPMPTVEGTTSSVAIPPAAVAVAPLAASRASLSPNPVAAGASVRLALPARPSGALEVFDLGGRRVGAATFAPLDGLYQANWRTRAESGQPLPPGVY